MKTCSTCNIKKEETEYYSRKTKAGNISYSGICKVCRRLQRKEWRENNKEKKQEADRKWRENNKEKKQEIDRKWRENNKDKKKLADKNWRENNKDYIRQYKKEYYHNNGFKKLIQNLVKRPHEKTDGTIKPKDTYKLVGLKESQIKLWFEFQFDPFMNWSNYGKYWHIDHVTPCSSFDLDNEEELKKCFHWENVRPLKVEDNRSKGNKILPMDILHQEEKVKQFKIQYATYLVAGSP